MSLVRAFTQRRQKSQDLANVRIGRAASQRQGRPVYRTQISSPVALLSSTNVLSYEAPNIAGTCAINGPVDFSSSTSSRNSQEDSDASTFDIHSNTDASSIENSPITPEAEPNHLSCYFKKPTTSTTDGFAPTQPTFDAPSIPQRVPSHSKKAHEKVHRKRSVQRMMSPPSNILRNSADMFRPIEASPDNPFGNELAQLDEVAEDLSSAVRVAENEVDAAYMETHGFAVCDAQSYIQEIQTLYDQVFLVEEPTWF